MHLKHYLTLSAFLILSTPAWAASAPGGHIDRIFVNGSIWTGDDAQPHASALAISNDTLVAVGKDAEVKALANFDTVVIDLQGRFVTPGFQDSHLHIPGASINSIDLSEIETLEKFHEKLTAFAKAHPDLPWITGRGWGYSLFPNQKADKKYIDAVISDRPVYLIERDSHMGIANSKALELAGITNDIQDPPNGHIVKNSEGDLTGEFQEAAQQLIRRHIPPETNESKYQSLLINMDGFAAKGLTAVQDSMTYLDNIPIFERAAAAGTLKQRIRFAAVGVPSVGAYSPNHHLDKAITEADIQPYIRLRETFKGPLLKMGAIKIVLDGTVDAQTASMMEPYTGSEKKGIPFWNTKELNQTVALYDKLGFQLMVHGIGDEGIHQALDALAYAAEVNSTNGRRHRIEHAEVPDLADISRFKELGVVASTQPMFANPDETVLTNYAPLLGKERASHANSFRLFDDAGIVQAFGSDWSVFDYSPIRGIAVAVTRETKKGTPPGGWYPKGRISVEAALRHYTIDGAYASFDEDIRGSITKGKLADFVVLSQDITKVQLAKIKDTKVLLTVMGGSDTYRSPEFK